MRKLVVATVVVTLLIGLNSFYKRRNLRGTEQRCGIYGQSLDVQDAGGKDEGLATLVSISLAEQGAIIVSECGDFSVYVQTFRDQKTMFSVLTKSPKHGIHQSSRYEISDLTGLVYLDAKESRFMQDFCTEVAGMIARKTFTRK